jgi:hypothetical protein
MKQAKSIVYKDKLKSYTYCLHRNNGEIYYVGVGIRNRAFQHTMKYEFDSGLNKLKINITKKEIEIGCIYYSIICLNKDRNKCLDIEKKVVNYFGRVNNQTGILSNMTEGGEIGPTGFKISEETREKIKQARANNRQSASEKAKNHWNSKTQEEKDQQIAKMLSGTNSPSARLSSGLKSKERWNSLELVRDTGKTYRELMSEIHTNRQKNPEKKLAT